jgi:hypothetical protein
MCGSGDGSFHRRDAMIRITIVPRYPSELVFFSTYLSLFESGQDAVLWSYEWQ